jgi:hypothetical protein
MGYSFDGFFAACEVESEHIVAYALARWPGCQAKQIHQPFRGIGVSVPDYNEAPTAEEAERWWNLLDQVGEEVRWLSQNYPHLAFVWIHAECFGGRCVYDGEVYRDGQILTEEKGEGALSRLVAYLGVSLPLNEFFAPFVRGFFD